MDFTGKKLHFVDRHTGEITPVEVFVAALGASKLIYEEAARSQKKLDLTQAEIMIDTEKRQEPQRPVGFVRSRGERESEATLMQQTKSSPDAVGAVSACLCRIFYFAYEAENVPV